MSSGWGAEDILQDVFVKFYSKIDQLRDESKVNAWLHCTTRNSIVDYYRKKSALSLPVSRVGGEIEVLDDRENANQEIADCIKVLLTNLSVEYVEALLLHDLEGLKHKEIAEELGLSVSGSKTRVRRARRQLKLSLLDCCHFEFDSYGNVLNYELKEGSQCQC